MRTAGWIIHYLHEIPISYGEFNNYPEDYAADARGP